MTASTQYKIIRRDRANFINKRARGGGLAIFICTGVIFDEIDLDAIDKIIAECLAVRFKIGHQFYLSITEYSQLNKTKTKLVTFSRKKEQDYESFYYLGTERIIRSSTVKDLGILFDEELTFIPHIDELIIKMNKRYGIGYRFAREVGHLELLVKIMKYQYQNTNL